MKRFTATEKWNKEWYQALSLKHKCLWQYLCDQCDHAGIFEPNFKQASFFIGTQINVDDLEAFGTRVTHLQSGKYAISGFVAFQYGELSEKNRAHVSVLRKLKHECIASELEMLLGKEKKEHAPYMPLECPLEGDKEKDKDKVQETDKEQEKEKRPSGLPMDDKEAVEWAAFGGIPPDFAREVFFQLDGKGWVDGTGQAITTWRSYLQGRWVRQQHEWLAKRKKETPILARIGTETGNHIAKLCRDEPEEQPKPDLSKIKAETPELQAMLKVASQ